MKLVVGLGNPGSEYAWSRHNAGWLLLDSFINKLGLSEPRMKFSGAFWPAVSIDGHSTAFLKPFTYMNLSGKSVLEAARYFDVVTEDILVLFDDAALPFGRLRYRASGSAGGQKGMISIIASLDTLDIPRLRMGVGSPPPPIAMRDWVLSKFAPDERKSWDKMETAAWGAFKRWLDGEAGSGFTVNALTEETS